MRNYLNLLAFEMNRWKNLYIGLLALIFALQALVVLYEIFTYLELVASNHILPEQVSDEYLYFKLSDVVSLPSFVLPFVLGLGVVFVYTFLIWYRDWFGRNTFIYRLLMLPVNRMAIFFAKITTIVLSLLGILAAQIVSIYLFQILAKLFIPRVYRLDLNIVSTLESSFYYPLMIPSHLSNFFVQYSLVFLFILLCFMFILFERSFRELGIIFGLGYGFAVLVLLLLPFLFQKLYLKELILIEFFLIAIVIGVTLYISHYILERKISV